MGRIKLAQRFPIPTRHNVLPEFRHLWDGRHLFIPCNAGEQAIGEERLPIDAVADGDSYIDSPLGVAMRCTNLDTAVTIGQPDVWVNPSQIFTIVAIVTPQTGGESGESQIVYAGSLDPNDGPFSLLVDSSDGEFSLSNSANAFFRSGFFATFGIPYMVMVNYTADNGANSVANFFIAPVTRNVVTSTATAAQDTVLALNTDALFSDRPGAGDRKAVFDMHAFYYFHDRLLGLADAQLFASNPFGLITPSVLIQHAMPTLLEALEGYRWRDDDAGEAAAAWLAAQDTDITRAVLTNTRLRGLVDASGDPIPGQYQVETRPDGGGEEDWVKVPVA